jgi:serine/threonine protein kinase
MAAISDPAFRRTRHDATSETNLWIPVVFRMNKPQPELLPDLQQSLSLPADIQITRYLGKGGRAYVYQAVLSQGPVVAKIYRKQTVDKYRDKYGVDIAEFEYQRNRSLYDLLDIRKYIARPYRVYSASSEFSHCIIQEYISGKSLKATIAELGYLPDGILEAGHQIVKQAEAHGIHDLDISSNNIIICNTSGELIPRIYDFNLMPQHLHAPNPFLGLAIGLGLRGKSHRDYRNLDKWERHGKNAAQLAAKYK